MKTSTWHKAVVTFPRELEEVIANFMFEAGAAGIENGDGSLAAYFDPQFSATQISAAFNSFISSLTELGTDTRSVTISFEEIENRDWNEEWKKNFTAQRITDNILVKPGWEPTPEPPPPCVIEIDPGMAFGTGTHETTILMLKLEEKQVFPGARVLDIGTGTGILAIAAAKLGAERVLAFDIDELATEAATENCRINHVETRVSLFTGTIEQVPAQTFDLILANVNKTEILKMLPQITAFMHEKSRLLLSGLLREEEESVTKALSSQKLIAVESEYMGEWVAITAAR